MRLKQRGVIQTSEMTSAIWRRTSREYNRIDWHVRIVGKVASLIRRAIPFPLSSQQPLSSIPSSRFFPLLSASQPPPQPSSAPSSFYMRRRWQKHELFYFLSSYLVTVWHDGNCTRARLHVSAKREENAIDISISASDGMRARRESYSSLRPFEWYFLSLNYKFLRFEFQNDNWYTYVWRREKKKCWENRKSLFK